MNIRRLFGFEDEATKLDKINQNFQEADKKKVEFSQFSDGWILADETWTYASADDPTYTFTISGDKTAKYSAGMRIKLTQTTAKYFIITAVAYASPNTTVTIYGGTDYDLANAAIISPYYSTQKAPFGFPIDPTKWTVEVTDVSGRSQANAASATWYNLGSITISVPIGVWSVEYSVLAQYNAGAIVNEGIYSTLSTANNSESDVDFTCVGANYINSSFTAGWTFYRRKTLVIAAKTSYYLNTKISTGGTGYTLYNSNDYSKLIIRAICAYI